MGKGPAPRTKNQLFQKKIIPADPLREEFVRFLIFSEEIRSAEEGRNFDSNLLEEAIYATSIGRKEIKEIRERARKCLK